MHEFRLQNIDLVKLSDDIKEKMDAYKCNKFELSDAYSGYVTVKIWRDENI